jgi:hypothetical protein
VGGGGGGFGQVVKQKRRRIVCACVSPPPPLPSTALLRCAALCDLGRGPQAQAQCARAWPRGRGLACQSDYPSDCLWPPRLFPQLDPSPPVLTQVRSVPPLQLHAQVQIDSARGTCGTCPPTQTLPAGPRSTAPKEAREGPDSLFTGDRRQPFNEELLGATYRRGSARHCSEMVHCVV